MINLKNIDDYTLVIVGTNGAIEYFGEKEEYRYHIEALKDYFYTYYFDLCYFICWIINFNRLFK